MILPILDHTDLEMHFALNHVKAAKKEGGSPRLPIEQ